MACKYVKDFQFGGHVSNTATPRGNRSNYADGGKVKAGLSYVEQAQPTEKQAILDGIAKGSQGKPGMLSCAAQAVKNKAIEKSPNTMRMIGITRDDEGEGYARGGPVTKHQKLATGQSVGYKSGGAVEKMTKPDTFVNAPPSLSKGVDRSAPPSITENMARGGMAMRKSGMPVGRSGPTDPSIKPFKRPSRRGKA